MTIWASWGADWLLDDKVSFDGINKIIYVHPDATEFDIRSDLYTSWVDWVSLYDHLKYKPAIRVTGLDPIGGGVYTGDVYFMINGWKLSIDLTKTKVTGVLYSDDYPTPYYDSNLNPVYPVTVSALVNTVSTIGGSGGATPAEIWNHPTRTLTTSASGASLAEIESSPVLAKQSTLMSVQTVGDSNAAKLAQIKSIIDTMDSPPNENVIATAVWSRPVSSMTDKTTIGGFINKMILSIPKFLGLK